MDKNDKLTEDLAKALLRVSASQPKIERLEAGLFQMGLSLLAVFLICHFTKETKTGFILALFLGAGFCALASYKLMHKGVLASGFVAAVFAVSSPVFITVGFASSDIFWNQIGGFEFWSVIFYAGIILGLLALIAGKVYAEESGQSLREVYIWLGFAFIVIFAVLTVTIPATVAR